MEGTNKIGHAGRLILVAPDSEGGGGISAANRDLRSRINRLAGDNHEHESRGVSQSISSTDILSQKTRELNLSAHIERGDTCEDVIKRHHGYFRSECVLSSGIGCLLIRRF